eukprot:TRINITY_DN7816_c0_g1_i1.p1 TRINITY_DN7816_c0_g1~~TRINITY_DN7816_c0_g1_i1.p1  ORF type:complete len:491 (-),score=96.45 TRINITY_DN7816_c0_g1_i1:61-1506(-)
MSSSSNVLSLVLATLALSCVLLLSSPLMCEAKVGSAVRLAMSRRNTQFHPDVTFAAHGTYPRYGGRSHPSWGHYRSTGGSIPLQGGLLTLGAYFVNISVGGQELTVLVDTGSSNLAVPSIGCPASLCGDNAAMLYNYNTSSTASLASLSSTYCQQCAPAGSAAGSSDYFCGMNGPMPGQDCGGDCCGFGITYGGGSSALAGNWGFDEVCINGTDVCSNATVGRIITPVQFFDPSQPQGIIGLASDFNACNPTCVPTIIDDWLASGAIPSQVFTMGLTNTDGGYLEFGSTDSSDSAVQFTPMTFDRWYNFAILDMDVGGQSIGVPPYLYDATNDVIGSFVDSGTSVVLMGPSIFGALEATVAANPTYSKLPGFDPNAAKSLWNGDCYQTSEIAPLMSKYPTFNFTMASAPGASSDTFTLPLTPSAYLMPTGKVTCFGIASVASLGVIFGDVMLTQFEYVVYDRANLQVGFGPLLNSSTITSY